MKDLLLCVHVVVNTLNLEISRCHVADYVKEFYSVRAAREARLIFLIQPIGSLFSGVVVAIPSSLLPNEADVSTAGPLSEGMTNFAERNSERMTNFAERIQVKEKRQD